MLENVELQKKLASGWTTYNVRSMASHVLLPEGLSISIGIKEFCDGKFLDEMLVRNTDNAEDVKPIAHSYDHSYTELSCEWRGVGINIQTTLHGENLVMSVNAFKNQKISANIIISVAILWGRPGYVVKTGPDVIQGVLPGKPVSIYVNGEESTYDPYVNIKTPYISLPLSQGKIYVTTGKRYESDEADTYINKAREAHKNSQEKYKDAGELYDAIENAIAWNTIYDPSKDRVITVAARTVSSNSSGGYVLFCWDTYFAAYLAAVGNKELAYANVLAMNSEKTPQGFIPNAVWAAGYVSRDRSEPPVGSAMALGIYKKYNEKWFLKAVFNDFFEWNTFNYNKRQIKDGLLAWGSNYYNPIYGQWWETCESGVGGRLGASLESGMDNSPLYDDVPFDENLGLLKLADVGFTSLYLFDTMALIQIAEIINRDFEKCELEERYKKVRISLEDLWDEESGLYLHKKTDTGEFLRRMSPTNFFPMLTGDIDHEKCVRMIKEHLLNEDEFWGEWVLPSISRNDPAYKDQDYWRGRIWAPLNFLVYIGLRMQGEFETASLLADKSVDIFLREWRLNKHIHENFNADTGDGCLARSDKFYHWGALLAVIGLMDKGYCCIL